MKKRRFQHRSAKSFSRHHRRHRWVQATGRVMPELRGLTEGLGGTPQDKTGDDVRRRGHVASVRAGFSKPLVVLGLFLPFRHPAGNRVAVGSLREPDRPTRDGDLRRPVALSHQRSPGLVRNVSLSGRLVRAHKVLTLEYPPNDGAARSLDEAVDGWLADRSWGLFKVSKDLFFPLPVYPDLACPLLVHVDGLRAVAAVPLRGAAGSVMARAVEAVGPRRAARRQADGARACRR